MRKPRVITKCVANTYAASNERIVEFSGEPDATGPVGGLLSFRQLNDGTLRVEIYRCDPAVLIITPATTNRFVTVKP